MTQTKITDMASTTTHIKNTKKHLARTVGFLLHLMIPVIRLAVTSFLIRVICAHV